MEENMSPKLSDKPNNPIYKGTVKNAFLKGRHISGQKLYEKLFNINN